MEAQVTNAKGKINIVLKNRQQETEQLQSAAAKRDIDPFRHIDQEFASFIGMEKLKKTIKEIYANVHISQKREAAGLKQEKQVLHMLFEGNPGTGKTTVARKLASVFRDMEVLDKGHFIEAERADLVGEYIGHTAQKQERSSNVPWAASCSSTRPIRWRAEAKRTSGRKQSIRWSNIWRMLPTDLSSSLPDIPGK